jgi:hypothetical protein
MTRRVRVRMKPDIPFGRPMKGADQSISLSVYDMELANLALTGFHCEYFLGMARTRA